MNFESTAYLILTCFPSELEMNCPRYNQNGIVLLEKIQNGPLLRMDHAINKTHQSRALKITTENEKELLTVSTQNELLSVTFLSKISH